MTMPTITLRLPDKIKAYRNKNNLSLKEFGKLIGVSGASGMQVGTKHLLSRYYLSATSCKNIKLYNR